MRLLLAAALLASAGCVRRQLTIRTEPPGAAVYVNDQLKGETPVSYDFTWYGHYRLTLRKEGYVRVDDRRMLRAPVWLWIPLDLVLELLPLTITDRRTWDYALTPQAELPEPAPPSLDGARDGALSHVERAPELSRQDPVETPPAIEEEPDAAR